jgi:thiamine kinase-like enzyme
MIASFLAARIAALPLWQGPVVPVALRLGAVDADFKVEDRTGAFLVRIGNDLPQSAARRFNARIAADAVFHAGLSPEVVHAEAGIAVMRFVAGRALSAADFTDPGRLGRVGAVVKTLHRDTVPFVRGPLLAYWVFHFIRGYARALEEDASPHAPRAAELLALAERLKSAVGHLDLVVAHNALRPESFIEEGDRLWLVGWADAGWNSPLFDLACLAAAAPGIDEEALLAACFDGPVDAALCGPFRALKCAVLIRDILQSMLSESRSELPFDYPAHTAALLRRFAVTHAAFESGG